ncbi:hypothetical protein BRD56_08595 [Thermoplasmatales archaeon SW_10_69_26]|nr:MAG: hypothetical protein BRD56_08595 [Thermoplasmatales archaeon SW_10_69_26]
MSVARLLAVVVLLGPALSAPVGATPMNLTQPARVTALAVSLNETGELVGANASIEVRASSDGSGHVFMDTRPLSGTDLQGSARIASRVAAGLAGQGLASHDLFYTVRSDSPIISGPSAGAVMTLAATVAMQNAHLAEGEDPWQIREDVMATGTINPDGSIGPVGGILEKAKAAEDAGASIFLVPDGEANYTPRLPPEQEEYGEAPVHVPSFCEEELNITCRSVAAIEELVEVATDRELPQPELGEPPTTAQYADILGPRTRDIVDRSERVYETWDKVNTTEMPDRAEERARSAIEAAVASHEEAEALWSDERFYSAASKAFQSAIRERHARLLATYYERGASDDFLEATVEHAAESVREARETASEAEVEGLHTLYTVGAGQERVSDAERRLQQAREALQGTGSVDQVLLQSAWAFERSNTVHWWLDLSQPFSDEPPLPEDPERLANEFANLARELIAYSSSVRGDTGDPQPAKDALQEANKDRERGFHAAAIIEAAEAQVLASLTLEQRNGEPSPAKVNASRQQAALSIQEARGLDVEPILPVAMFEFASTSENPSTAVRFYRTANTLAGLSSVLTVEEDPQPSRFVDPQADDREDHTDGPIEGLQLGVASWAVVGVFAALSALTLVSAIVRDDEDS